MQVTSLLGDFNLCLSKQTFTAPKGRPSDHREIFSILVVTQMLSLSLYRVSELSRLGLICLACTMGRYDCAGSFLAGFQVHGDK